MTKENCNTLNDEMMKNNMKCDKRFVISNEKNLISPAGFHSEQRVFKKTKIAIHCNKIPKKLPKTNVPLYAHDINEICGNEEWPNNKVWKP